MINLWREIEPGPHIPEVIYVIVEIAKGSRNKYEYDKVLAVPDHDPIFDDYQDIKDIPQHFLKEVAHFFEVYKDLEGKRAKPLGWESALVAKTEINRSIALYRENYGRGMRI